MFNTKLPVNVNVFVTPSNVRFDSTLPFGCVPFNVITPLFVVPLKDNKPDVPDVPVVPDVPDVPEVPLVPDVPVVPEVPDVPLVPDVPEVPVFEKFITIESVVPNDQVPELAAVSIVSVT